MRLWSLDPRYLDPKGLVALWREALLAQAVLRGRTKGYKNHPQLERFKVREKPVGAVADYLRAVRAEAVKRGYSFDASRIAPARGSGRISVTRGQLRFEWKHLMRKLSLRAPRWKAELKGPPRPHPSFRVVPGPVASWERP